MPFLLMILADSLGYTLSSESLISLVVSSSFKNLLKKNWIQKLRFSNVMEEKSSVQLNLLTMFNVVALNSMRLVQELLNKTV